MTWEWVALILGIFTMFFIVLGFSMWTSMRIKINATYPKTFPDMMARTKNEEEDAGTEE